MKIALTVYLDPLMLPHDVKMMDVPMIMAEAFAQILEEKNLKMCNGFEISFNADQEAPTNPPTGLPYEFLKSLTKKTKENREKNEDKGTKGNTHEQK